MDQVTLTNYTTVRSYSEIQFIFLSNIKCIKEKK